MISDAAKEVHVESHVLRYWEEELHLPIRRNELGHRYYTREDVERFKQIKSMKERGLQLKAIKMILKDGKIDVMMPEEEKEAIKKEEDDRNAEKASQEQEKADIQESRMAQNRIPESRGLENRTQEHGGIAIDIVDSHDTSIAQESKEDKARRLQWLLQQLIRETLQENNKELCRDIKDSVVKELDYQFRAREEREEERDSIMVKRNEEYYQRMDELLRSKSRKRRFGEGRMERKRKEEEKNAEVAAENEKKAETKAKLKEKNRKGRKTTAEDEPLADSVWEELKDVKIAEEGTPQRGKDKKEPPATVDEKIALKNAEKAAAKAEKGKRKRHSIF